MSHATLLERVIELVNAANAVIRSPEYNDTTLDDGKHFVVGALQINRLKKAAADIDVE